MADLLRPSVAIAAKDFLIEWRSRTALLSATVFAALVLVVFNFARDPASLSPVVLAPSVLWVTTTFAAMLTLNRAFMLERENEAGEALRLAPISPNAVFLGKYLANLAFVGVVDLVVLPLFVLFFNVDFGGVLLGLIGVIVLANLGFIAVGTLFSAMAVRTRFAELMLPVLLLPFLIPPLIGAVQATTRILAHRPLSELMGWLRLLGLYDIVFFTVCLLVFPSVSDE